MRTLALVLVQNGKAIVGAAVTLKDGGTSAGGTSNQDGYFAATLHDVPYVEVLIDAKGFLPYHATLTVPLGNYELHLIDALVPLVTVPPAPHLEVRGNDFVDAAGSPACYSGVDRFMAMRLFLDKRFSDLEQLVQESHEFEMPWWRVLMMGSIKQNFIMQLDPREPGYYQAAHDLPRWLNDRGCGLLCEAYADNQDIGCGIEHWNGLRDAVHGTATILSGGNEWPKNGFDPQVLDDPGMIWSRGSATADMLTPQNGATCASFHQRTDWPATIQDATASLIYMEQNGYTVCLMDEPTRFDDLSNKSGVPNSEEFAWQLARVYGTFWDLAVFHNYCGARCIPLTPNLRRVAAAWQRGLRG